MILRGHRSNGDLFLHFPGGHIYACQSQELCKFPSLSFFYRAAAVFNECHAQARTPGNPHWWDLLRGAYDHVRGLPPEKTAASFRPGFHPWESSGKNWLRSFLSYSLIPNFYERNFSQQSRTKFNCAQCWIHAITVSTVRRHLLNGRLRSLQGRLK